MLPSSSFWAMTSSPPNQLRHQIQYAIYPNQNPFDLSLFIILAQKACIRLNEEKLSTKQNCIFALEEKLEFAIIVLCFIFASELLYGFGPNLFISILGLERGHRFSGLLSGSFSGIPLGMTFGMKYMLMILKKRVKFSTITNDSPQESQEFNGNSQDGVLFNRNNAASDKKKGGK